MDTVKCILAWGDHLYSLPCSSSICTGRFLCVFFFFFKKIKVFNHKLIRKANNCVYSTLIAVFRVGQNQQDRVSKSQNHPRKRWLIHFFGGDCRETVEFEFLYMQSCSCDLKPEWRRFNNLHLEVKVGTPPVSIVMYWKLRQPNAGWWGETVVRWNYLTLLPSYRDRDSQFDLD